MNRESILEFYLQESSQKEEGKVAQNVRLIYNPNAGRSTANHNGIGRDDGAERAAS